MHANYLFAVKPLEWTNTENKNKNEKGLKPPVLRLREVLGSDKQYFI